MTRYIRRMRFEQVWVDQCRATKAIKRRPHRPVVLLEGPRPLRMPQIHPHALKGAMASLA
jgi:ERCC4-type nuclease